MIRKILLPLTKRTWATPWESRRMIPINRKKTRLLEFLSYFVSKHNLKKHYCILLLTDFGGGQTFFAQFLNLFLNILSVEFQPGGNGSSVGQGWLGNTLSVTQQKKTTFNKISKHYSQLTIESTRTRHNRWAAAIHMYNFIYKFINFFHYFNIFLINFTFNI